MSPRRSSIRRVLLHPLAAAPTVVGAAVLLCTLVLHAPARADEACTAPMAEPVEERLLPVLQALNHARHQRGVWSRDDDAAFRALLDAADDASAEARVALMDYYVGEAASEALVCAVARDGRRSAAWLARYGACDIAPQRLPLPRNHGGPMREQASAAIASGDVAGRCTVQ